MNISREWTFPLSILAHPIRGFEEVKSGRRGSLVVAAAIVALFFLAEVANRQLRGFPFNPYRPDKLNVLLVLAQTVAPYLLWVVANWCLCTLMDGEGKFREICVATAYALLPLVLVTLIVVTVSNVMTLDEGAFIGLLEGVRQLWFVLLLTVAMKVTHQYSLPKTIVSMLLTVIGIGIILFLGILVFSLFQQLGIFIRTVYSEILFRG